MQATSFLPDDALPAQRCWHVRNDYYERPRCPVTGEFTKWCENRYLTYISLSAKASCPEVRQKMTATYNARTGFTGSDWRSAPEVKAKAAAAFSKSAAEGKHKKYTRSKAWHAKIQETWNKKIDPNDAASFRAYRNRVNRHTNKNYRLYKDILESHGLIRSRENHIDHIFSVYEAWEKGIPAEIVGHWTNLRIIDGRLNSSKHTRSDKSVEQLYADYESAKPFK